MYTTLIITEHSLIIVLYYLQILSVGCELTSFLLYKLDIYKLTSIVFGTIMHIATCTGTVATTVLLFNYMHVTVTTWFFVTLLSHPILNVTVQTDKLTISQLYG